MNADDKIDLKDAIVSASVLTASFTFALGMIYFLAFLNLFDISILSEIRFVFVVFSVIITFNLLLCYNLIDQVLS
jgi:hypothetical protein